MPALSRTVVESLKIKLRPLRVYRAVRFGWHFATDPIFRRDHVLLWRQPKNLFQHRSITFPDRYPGIFAYVREQLTRPVGAPVAPAPRILSFGCATGEEVFSLRKVFPAAHLRGLDINRANIAACRAQLRSLGGDSAITFDATGSAAAEPTAAYDAAFCMAVFVRWQLKEDRAVATSAPLLQFTDFARATAELARCVRPGGLLVLRHAMFRFSDTAAAHDFRVLLRLPLPEEFFPRFGRDNQRLPADSSEEVVFQKNVRVESPDQL